MSEHDSIIANLTKTELLNILIILVVTWVLLQFTTKILPGLAERFSGKTRFQILSLLPLFRLVILIVSIVAIVPIIIEPSQQGVLTIIGASSLILGFAFKDYINSLIAGVVTLYEAPYRPGDWVEIDGHFGEVQSIGLRSLKLLTPDNQTVIIPQLKYWDTPIINSNSGKREILVVTNFYVNPDHDPELVKQKLYDVAISSPYTQLTHPIKISMEEEPWGSHYRIKAYPLDARDQFSYKTDLTIRGKKALREEGIDFVSHLL